MRQISNTKLFLIKHSANILNFFNGFPFSYFYGGIGQILMFHRVIPTDKKNRIWSNSYLEITPEYLENIILYYKKLNFRFISIDDFFHESCSQNFKSKFIVITFDDGFKDNLTYAYPVLKKHNVPFTIYITTDFPENKANLWWNDLENLILSSKKISFDFNDNHFDFSIENFEDKNFVYEKIHNLIKSTPEDKQNELLKKIFQNYKTETIQNEILLNWEDIKRLSEDNIVTIGAHTVSHKNLYKLTDEQKRFEIKDSKRIIEEKIEKKVEHFAYPFGGQDSFDIKTIEYLKNTGFKTAVTTISKNITKKSLSNLFTLPRIACGMSMTNSTLDLIRHGVIPMIRNKGKI